MAGLARRTHPCDKRKDIAAGGFAMDLEELERRLTRNAFLFDDPRTYRAGVADALDAVRRLQRWQDVAARAVPDAVVSVRLQKPPSVRL